MAEETEISTPVESADLDTSSNVEPVSEKASTTDTLTEEPKSEIEAAESTEDGTTQKRLYANKYTSVEELEKGYSEAQKFVAKASEFEKKYNELMQAQEQTAKKHEQELLLQAQRQGYNSVDEQQIAQKTAVAEFEYYANNINSIDPQYFENVRSNLLQYYQTGNANYLNEAKKYFPSDFIERVAIEKLAYENQLKNEVKQKQRKALDSQEQALAETLKTDFAEFLSDIKENQGKSRALEAFCNTGHIQSVEDMQAFQEIYSLIEKTAKENAVQEYLANQAIEQTKEKALINAGNEAQGDINTSMPSLDQLEKMSREDYSKAVDKWGLTTLLAQK